MEAKKPGFNVDDFLSLNITPIHQRILSTLRSNIQNYLTITPMATPLALASLAYYLDC